MFLGLCLSIEGISQDIHFSQYGVSFANFNPALTGAFDGKYRVHLHSRRQWSSLISNPYFTNYLSFDVPFNNNNNFNYASLGASIINDQVGDVYSNLSANIAASYKMSPFSNKNHQIALGAEAGLVQKSIKTENLYFGNQFDKSTGTYNQSSAVETDLFGGSGVMNNIDINAGILYSFSSKTSFVNPYFGASVYHLLPAKESLYNLDYTLPMRINIHGGAKINLMPKLQLVPQVIYMQQGPNNMIMVDVFAHARLSGYNTFLIGGLSNRLSEAGIVHFGLMKGRYSGMISYDVNISKLSNYTNYQGAFEFSFTYILSNPTVLPKLNSCPSL